MFCFDCLNIEHGKRRYKCYKKLIHQYDSCFNMKITIPQWGSRTGYIIVYHCRELHTPKICIVKWPLIQLLERFQGLKVEARSDF
jgi:hypothetical protein